MESRRHELTDSTVYLLIIAHFMKREFESALVHKFSHATMPIANVFRKYVPSVSISPTDTQLGSLLASFRLPRRAHRLPPRQLGPVSRRHSIRHRDLALVLGPALALCRGLQPHQPPQPPQHPYPAGRAQTVPQGLRLQPRHLLQLLFRDPRLGRLDRHDGR